MILTKNPFRLSVEDFSEDPDETIQEFLDMIHRSTAKASFEDESLVNFWVMMEKAYPKVARKPLSLLAVFPSTYLCESAFSSVVKTKTQKLLDLDLALRPAISKIAPHISSIVDKKNKGKSRTNDSCKYCSH